MHKAPSTSVNVPLSEKQLNGVVEIIARPNRSASPATLLGVFAALAFSVLMVSLFSYLQGNVWAPLFALADLALVAVCFRWVWRRGEDYDCIRLDSEKVAIESRRGPQARTVSYQTGWARVWSELDRRGDGSNVFVGSHGKRTEVGSFLIDAQRAHLEALIKMRLGQARLGPGHEGFENVARGHTA
jgi:uncharacterized membrane protein